MSSNRKVQVVSDEIIPENLTPQELQEKAEWLKQQIEKSISTVSKMKQGNKTRAAYIKIGTILLSGTATILLGLRIVGLDSIFKDTAFVLGAVVTLLNALEPFFNYRALWVESEKGKARFHRLKDDFDYYLIGTPPEKINRNVLNQFHKRNQEIWINLSGAWEEQRQSSRTYS